MASLSSFSLHTQGIVPFVCLTRWVLAVVIPGLSQNLWHTEDGSESKLVYERPPVLHFSRLKQTNKQTKNPKEIKPLNATHHPKLAPVKNTVATIH